MVPDACIQTNSKVERVLQCKSLALDQKGREEDEKSIDHGSN